MFSLETIFRSTGAYSDAFLRNQNMDGALTLQLGICPNVVGGAWLGVVCDGTSDSQGKLATRTALRSVCVSSGELLAVLPRLRDKMDKELAQAGELPAQEVMRRTQELLCARLFPLLRELIADAHSRILEIGLDSAATMTVALIFGGYAFTANLGDSPAFLLRREDEQVQWNAMYRRHHDGRGLTRWIGGGSNFQLTDIPVFCSPLSPESLLVLGSDGALPPALDEELAGALDSRDDFNEQCAFLLRRAEATGSTDNFTYVSARTVLGAE